MPGRSSHTLFQPKNNPIIWANQCPTLCGNGVGHAVRKGVGGRCFIRTVTGDDMRNEAWFAVAGLFC